MPGVVSGVVQACFSDVFRDMFGVAQACFRSCSGVDRSLWNLFRSCPDVFHEFCFRMCCRCVSEVVSGIVQELFQVCVRCCSGVFLNCAEFTGVCAGVVQELLMVFFFPCVYHA